jgi:hypothetical protein
MATMVRLNGIGLTHLGIEPRGPNGDAWATVWFTFFYLPVFPLRRERIRFLPRRGSGYAFRVIERGPFDLASIARSYAFSWLFMPLVVGLPLAALTREAWRALGLPEALYLYAFGAWVVWACGWIWGLLSWRERCCRPAEA